MELMWYKFSVVTEQYTKTNTNTLVYVYVRY